MKRIEALIRENKLDAVARDLASLNVPPLTVSEARIFCPGEGEGRACRGIEYRTDFVARLRVEIVVEESTALQVVDAIVHAAADRGEDVKVLQWDLDREVSEGWSDNRPWSTGAPAESKPDRSFPRFDPDADFEVPSGSAPRPRYATRVG